MTSLQLDLQILLAFVALSPEQKRIALDEAQLLLAEQNARDRRHADDP